MTLKHFTAHLKIALKPFFSNNDVTLDLIFLTVFLVTAILPNFMHIPPLEPNPMGLLSNGSVIVLKNP